MVAAGVSSPICGKHCGLTLANGNAGTKQTLQVFGIKQSDKQHTNSLSESRIEAE